ncbi:MAG: 2-dehydro-3-deoxygalactonokinase [Chthoniobacteraceae bacterium]
MNAHLFLSCDWGTTHFRLRLVNAEDGTIVDELKTPDGVARMSAGCRDTPREEYYAQFLACQAGVLLGRNNATAACCVISGMASSRLGWKELPYAVLPQPLDGSGLVVESLCIPVPDHPELEVVLVSGVRSDENVMRGEEVEIIGLAKSLPFIANAADITVILPGTHSKHVRLSNGRIMDFETLMTGELYQSLSAVPTLRDSISPGVAFEESHPSFVHGLQEAMSPGFFKSLFKIRARNLLKDASATDGSAYLSGLLIGTELIQVSAKPGSRVLIASSGLLNVLYHKAAAGLGLSHIGFVAENEMERSTVNGHLEILHSRTRNSGAN